MHRELELKFDALNLDRDVFSQWNDGTFRVMYLIDEGAIDALDMQLKAVVFPEDLGVSPGHGPMVGDILF